MQLKLTAYKGTDPEDGSGTYMITLTDPGTPDALDCFAMTVDEHSDHAIQDIEGVKMAFALGIWRLGRAQPIAHEFLTMPTTEQLWQTDVEGGRRQ